MLNHPILDNSTPEKAEKNQRFFGALSQVLVMFYVLFCGWTFRELELRKLVDFSGYGAIFGYFIGSIILIGREGWTKTAFLAWFKGFRRFIKIMAIVFVLVLLLEHLFIIAVKNDYITLTPNSLMRNLHYFSLSHYLDYITKK